MSENRTFLRHRPLPTPRVAAVAGILFALLYAISLMLVRLSIPPDRGIVDAVWLESNGGMIELALNIVPYAGIAFLWFIGVIRDRLGVMEDRFFATVFLSSGLLFLAMTFAGAALAGGLLSSYTVASSAMLESGVFTFGREVMYHIINIYALRMAGVFMISLGTIWLRTGLMSRVWAFLTYLLAVVLLVAINYSLWISLVFPGWVLAVSVHFLLYDQHNARGATAGEGGNT